MSTPISRRFIVTVADADADPDEKHYGPYTEADAKRVQASLRARLDELGFRAGDPPYVWVNELHLYEAAQEEYGITGDDRSFALLMPGWS